MSKWWHNLQHRLGWWSGHVVSRTDQAGRLYIGFMCDQCCTVTGEHDATNMIDRRINVALNAPPTT